MLHAVLVHAVLAASSSSSTSKKGSSFFPILVLLAIGLLLYFVMLRPARNRQRAALAQDAEQREQIGVGAEIITTSGLIGTIVSRTDDEVTLEIAPGVHARYVPAAIMRLRADDVEPVESPAVGPENDITNHEVIDPASEPMTDPTSLTPDVTDGSTEIPPETPDEPTTH